MLPADIGRVCGREKMTPRGWILSSCFWILVITAMLKLMTILVGGRALQTFEPVLGLPTRWIVLLAGLVEINACVYLVYGHENSWKGLMVAAIGAELLLYHAMLWAVGYTGPCACMGGLWQWTGISDHWINVVSELLALYLCLCGCVLFVQARKNPPPRLGSV